MFGVFQIPALAAAGVAATLVGIQLGSSTIAAINPAFFRGPAVHPRDRGVALDPQELEARRLARQAAAYGNLYGWDEGENALRLACAGCTAGLPVAHAYQTAYQPSVPYFGSREEIAADEARIRREIDEHYEARLAAEAERRARFALVERYAHPLDETATPEGVGGPEELPPEEAPPEEAPPEESEAD